LSPHVKHLIIAALVAVVVLGVTWKVIASQDQRDHDKVVLAQHQLELDAKTQKAAENQAQTDKLAYDSVKAQMASQNAQLLGQIASLRASLQAQQDRDRALPPSELAERHIGLIGGVPGDVTPAANGILMTIPAARQTVVMLEEIPSDRATIKGQEQLIANEKTELSSLQTALTSSGAALDACKATQSSAALACKAELAEVKASARKRNIVIAVLAAVGGFLLRTRI